MVWTSYAYMLKPDGGAAIDPIALGYATSIRIIPEIAAGMRGQPSTIHHRHGQVIDSRRFYASFDFFLDIVLSYGPNPATHADGSPGHVYENRSFILQGFPHTVKSWVQRTAPHQGAVEIPVIASQPIQTASPRNRLIIPCRTLDPLWRRTTLKGGGAIDPTAGITHDGDGPIGDMIITFTGMNGIQRLTHTTSGDWIELNADTTGTDIIVDLSDKSVLQGATPVDSVMTFKPGSPWGIELAPGANAFTLSGSGSVSVDLYEKWR